MMLDLHEGVLREFVGRARMRPDHVGLKLRYVRQAVEPAAKAGYNRARKAAGKCLRCAMPAALHDDGRPMARCEACRLMHNARRSRGV